MVRIASGYDIDRIMEIYALARDYMRKTGNPTQWSDDYPGVELIESDIDKQRSYVLYDDAGIYGVFYFEIGADPTYSYIEGGAWIDDNEAYGVIHRIASDGTHRRILDETVQYCEGIIHNLRIDTHNDNKIMQAAICRNGFKKCGIIYLPDGDPRIAYQKII